MGAGVPREGVAEVETQEDAGERKSVFEVFGHQVAEICDHEVVARSRADNHQHHDPKDLGGKCFLFGGAGMFEIQTTLVFALLVLALAVEGDSGVDECEGEGAEEEHHVACLFRASRNLSCDEIKISAKEAVLVIDVLWVAAVVVEQSE